MLGWAHRGVHCGLPSHRRPIRAGLPIPADGFENTLMALRGAAAHSGDGLELDIRMTSDNEPVILHDASLEHFGSPEMEVARTSYTELRQRLDAAGYRLSHLAELLEIDLPTETILEWKPAEVSDDAWAKVKPVFESIRRRTRVTFSSFYTEPLGKIRHWTPCRRGLLWSGTGGFEDFSSVAVSLDVDELHLPLKVMPSISHESIAATGLPFCVYTVNSPDGWEVCARLGARAIFTDDLDGYLAWRKARVSAP